MLDVIIIIIENNACLGATATDFFNQANNFTDRIVIAVFIYIGISFCDRVAPCVNINPSERPDIRAVCRNLDVKMEQITLFCKWFLDIQWIIYYVT